MNASCHYCGAEMNVRFMWKRIQGWEAKAQAGSRKSGSDIVLREPTGELACETCIGRLRRGVSPEQGKLV